MFVTRNFEFRIKGGIRKCHKLYIGLFIAPDTELTPEESAYPPTVSYPEEGASANKLHTLVLLDAELNKLHWMVIDIPGAKVHKGKTITAYAGPNPAENTGTHR